MVYEDQIPGTLMSEEQWVAWRSEERDGTATKVPVNPQTGEYAKVDQPATWTAFDAALQYYRDYDADGVGFVFHEDGGFAGVDLDDCRDPDQQTVAEWAVEVLTRLDSYTERSPSGTGFHIYMMGSLPGERNRRGDIELYDQRRFLTVTGDHVQGTPRTVEERGDALAAVYDAYLAATDQEKGEVDPATRSEQALSDKELLEKAMTAANGDKFRRLWQGDTSGYPSHSEADLALLCHLSFWTAGDPQRMERLFDKSGLTRDKWCEREDYRTRSIHKAITLTNEFYDPETDG